jgi:hypothetical protein
VADVPNGLSLTPTQEKTVSTVTCLVLDMEEISLPYFIIMFYLSNMAEFLC